MKNNILLIVLVATLFVSCKNGDTRQKEGNENTTKPNILWIYLEDTAPLMGCYGEQLVATPNIDSLAMKGVLYTNVFMPAPVCSASRSSIITGMMATTIGAQNHHGSRTVESATYLPENIKTIPELFKEAGYFTFNNGKDDYNFIYDRKELYDQDYSYHPLYGKGGVRLDLATLTEKEPFFGQIQMYGGKEIFNSKFKENVTSPVDRSKIQLPPYLPNHPVIIEEYANHLDAIQITDEKVGEVMNKLKENDLLKNTIVFFFSDHGMRLTRNKQFLYDGGLQVPLIIADFRAADKQFKPGSVNDDLISGLDLGTSSLALASIPIPEYMEGRNMFNPRGTPREYVISTRDRCDFTIDRIRSVRSKEYKYIRNFMTDRPYSQPTYMDFDKIEFVGVMKQLYAEGKLNEVQRRFMSDERPSEELYDLKADPFELNNLAVNSEYSEILTKYRSILDQWIAQTGDKGQYGEDEAGLKFMLGIWGKECVNPEYDALRKKYPNFEGSLIYLKSESFTKVDPNFKGTPLFDVSANQVVNIKLGR
ncbi:sulfatase family protein [Zobellia galactanivorans]|uniref:sulfatase family protein n=1 Tax=Zobellia galactanivorans (strain DSM 12802 / CCUG 47099 / CIP 106680 / NCIMB 13871 / Dsij) TaxID=63186 RepID=UPI001C06C745|nr:sulfatase [Zobellia galactanivorans]MBU3028399.1 sulfatase [Zobellia galactanivorans]